MHFSLKQLFSMRKREISFLWGLISLTILFFLSFSPVFAPAYSAASGTGFKVVEPQDPITETPLIQENSFLASSNHYSPKNDFIILETMQMTITAYSSSILETDDTPFITASGTTTKDGVIASNLLPFGTKIRIPGLFGDKVFVVEDRMNKRMGDFQVDIWFPSSESAQNFGVKYAHIETVI